VGSSDGPIRPTRRSKSDHSRMGIGLGGTSSATSRRAHRYVYLRLLRWRFLHLPLTIPSLRAVRSANCGCIRPASCPSSFRAGSNRSGAYSCPRARPHCPLLGSAPLLRLLPSWPSMLNRRCGHTFAHHSMSVTRSLSPTLPTPAHSAMSMRSNAAD